MMRVANLGIVVGIALLMGCDAPEEAFSIAKIFNDNMVLQRDRPIPIWGRGWRVSRLR